MLPNTAAWLEAKQARLEVKLEVKSAPYTPPRENEIVVKNHAVAVNPIDWILQVIGSVIFPLDQVPVHSRVGPRRRGRPSRNRRHSV